ncbi:hypothetical protein FGO68_gene16960 [Halteria grandinella]|uniref:Uncharacterized protein n=1 Tax=Halteria grandinella TaxID=5974 RepID=A0A8J8T3C6_HALGN|nr:hypothetical protein FGO68_gene16960 [Halteria grandinella]
MIYFCEIILLSLQLSATSQPPSMNDSPQTVPKDEKKSSSGGSSQEINHLTLNYSSEGNAKDLDETVGTQQTSSKDTRASVLNESLYNKVPEHRVLLLPEGIQAEQSNMQQATIKIIIVQRSSQHHFRLQHRSTRNSKSLLKAVLVCRYDSSGVVKRMDFFL